MFKLALPKGRLQSKTAELLDSVGIGLDNYTAKSRNYKLQASSFPELSAKVFQERDVSIQVAIGNYDLGICGYNWVEELTSKYPSSAVVIVRGLGYGRGKLCVGASPDLGIFKPEDVASLNKTITLASENPNLAESYAARLRLKRFQIFPVWGAAEVYPSFGTDLAIFTLGPDKKLDTELVPLDFISSTEAFLIANRNSWQDMDLGRVLDLFSRVKFDEPEKVSYIPAASEVKKLKNEKIKIKNGRLSPDFRTLSPDIVRLALPDGHQQKHTITLLDRCGIQVGGYNAPAGKYPFETGMEHLVVKVIRPQDMPAQVACGNFDIAVTGRDWLTDHLNDFPTSPVKEIADLKHGLVKIVAVVSRETGINDIDGLRERFSDKHSPPLRVASEYVNTADKYCCYKHFGHYKVIPTWGASEAFLPEDADLLIENTETGETLARHNLIVIDTLMESTACIIGSTEESGHHGKRKTISSLVDKLRKAASEE
ncbi:MAG: ATP phosphoribosyltransferase [Dehalococcoidia bacterium]|nr:ATP phosphoribosyltransferase [Dehalococcoidia bacterium]